MEVIFNELSLIPIEGNPLSPKEKVLVLLETMKSLKQYDINVLRTHNNFYAEDLGGGYTFSHFINDNNIKQDLRLLLRSITKCPFIEDDSSEEAETFISDSYTTKNHVNKEISPEGLAVAYIYNSPIISISGFPFWEQEFLTLNITSSNSNECISEIIVNLSTINSITNNAFKNWLNELSESIRLNSEDVIIDYFSSLPITFEKRALEDILFFYYNDKRFLKRIIELIKDILVNPFVGGKGHTEVLSHSSGKASKRIVKKDRIIYTFKREETIIHQCRFHYDDK